MTNDPGVLFRTPEAQIGLSPAEADRLAAHSLSPEEFFAICDAVGCIWLTHDDFYDPETGEALQPMMASVGEPAFRIVRVTPIQDWQLEVEWENGRIASLDMKERLKHGVFRPVLADPAVFKHIEIEEWGWGIFWPEAVDAALPSRRLYAWADGKDSEFD